MHITPLPLLLKAAESFLTRISAAELDSRVTHVSNALTVVLIAQVHTVCVAVTAPAIGNAQAIHPTLELIYMAATWRTGSCRETSRKMCCKISQLCSLANLKEAMKPQTIQLAYTCE